MPKSKSKPRKADGMTVEGLRSEDFNPMTPKQLGVSLRKSAPPKKPAK